MSSYLEKQQAQFKSSAISAAPQIATKKRKLTAPTPESAPSPAPSNTSTTSKADSKAPKKKESANVVYSQPATTGYGTDAFTQVTYVIDFLKKKKDEAKTFKDILEYLSQMHADDRMKQTIARVLKKHDRVQWFPDPSLKTQTWYSGKFMHRPIINVRSKGDLLAHLQRKADAQGVSVKDLKDGWPDCEEAIDELEREHKILVTRTKKDNHARMVWSDDPTLFHATDPEFQVMWHKIELPSVDELVRKLQEAGQKPASEDPAKRIKAAPKLKEKKKRAARSGGKTTNLHMSHLLKDYSYMKK